jgi:hypothetical protein
MFCGLLMLHLSFYCKVYIVHSTLLIERVLSFLLLYTQAASRTNTFVYYCNNGSLLSDSMLLAMLCILDSCQQWSESVHDMQYRQIERVNMMQTRAAQSCCSVTTGFKPSVGHLVSILVSILVVPRATVMGLG